MKLKEIEYPAVIGKTYSLFGSSCSTEDYYKTIKEFSDKILERYEINAVLESIHNHSSKKKYMRKLVSGSHGNSLLSFCLSLINNELKQYTVNTKGHLGNLPVSKFWDRRLATTEEQYHLYMLEIELTNRKNRYQFLSCERKISLQPYCLQDFAVNCKASGDDFDRQCRFCSVNCFQNHASRILKNANIEPYIWMGADIRKAAKEAQKNSGTFGILGIACIPELVWGMRKCEKYRIPAVGIPLNANRCVRWFGEFHKNSVDLNELEKLIKI